MKKGLSLVLSILLLLSITATFGLSAFAVTSGDFEYRLLSNGTAEIKGYSGSATKIIIPSTIDGYTVTSIGNYAFSDCSGLTNVTIGNSVKSIGEAAFRYCSGLTNITIPNSVTSIGEDAFEDCTGLTSITIPNSVTSIGNEVFYNCTRLTRINWNAENVTDYSSSVFYNAGTAGSGIDVVFGDNVKTIPAYAFNQSFEEEPINIKSVTIGNSVTSIGESAFSGCSGLTNITIPDSVISIGEGAFSSCTGLTNVTIGNRVTIIGYEAFRNCSSLTSITIPDSVTSIGNGAFSYCSGLTEITIPDSVTSIGNYAFSDCTGLTEITIGNGLTNINPCSFWGCKGLTQITIPESIETIGDCAFYSCYNLTDIYIMNPDCTISNNYDNIPQQAVIHGYHNSTAWKYANGLGRKFVFIDAHTLEEEFKLPATCSAYGFRTLSCEYCDYKTNETIEPLGHTDTDGDGLCDICKIGLSGGQTSCDHEYEIDYIAPTCSDSGKIIMTCSLCGKSSQKAIEATGHNYVDFVIEPTCTSDGYTKHYCINCGDEVRDSVVKAMGHEMRTMTITPTCTENGCDIEICNNCGYNYETNMVYALGHMDEDNNGECDDCGYKIETQEEPTKISFFEKLIALLRRFIEMIISLFK